MANVRQAVTGLDDIFKKMDGLLDARVTVARAMGVAMGDAVRDEALQRVPTLQPGNGGFDNQRENQLKEAIYLAFDGRRSLLNEGYLVYGVSWNRRKAPHGHLLEFGHWMPYEAHQDAEDGRWFTPIITQARSRGRKRAVGIRITEEAGPSKGFFVAAHPFLGPAFDAKLPQLKTIAAAAASVAWGQMKT